MLKLEYEMFPGKPFELHVVHDMTVFVMQQHRTTRNI